MKLTLGIDTGGTFTDVVILDPSNHQVRCKAKAPTTPEDLSIGIAEALDFLHGINYSDIQMVALSTTLATNSIVEGHGGRVGLLLIGYDEEIMHSEGLSANLPVETTCYLNGGHDVKGIQVHPLDLTKARQVITDIRDQVDAFAVSGYFSVMNPEHEIQIRNLIYGLADAPVVCGFELTSKLNALKRVSTAVLNARLLPVISRLMDSVVKVLSDRGISAPLMVVKGDGSLINEKYARSRPVETILSGPVASALGGHYLSGENSAIVVDMGGTTTDIAILERGRPWINPVGARVGGWQTCVEAADLRTIGLGGDSHIRVERDRTLCVGPQRVIPLCKLAEDSPEIVRELEGASYAYPEVGDRRVTEFLLRSQTGEKGTLDQTERLILETLDDGPLSLSKLRDRLDQHLLPIERLESLGLLRRAGLTPTDLFWSEAIGIGGVGAAAQAGARIVAKQLGISEVDLLPIVTEYVVDKVAKEILDKFITDEYGQSLFPAPPAWSYFVEQMLTMENAGNVSGTVRVELPIIAIGAPVEEFIPAVATKLGTRCVIPEHAEVGNAVGAIIASVTRTVEILIQPYVKGAGTVSYVIHAPSGREEATSFSRAVRRAEDIAVELARKAVYQAGAKSVQVDVEKKEIALGKLKELTIRATATGKPRLVESRSSPGR